LTHGYARRTVDVPSNGSTCWGKIRGDSDILDDLRYIGEGRWVEVESWDCRRGIVTPIWLYKYWSLNSRLVRSNIQNKEDPMRRRMLVIVIAAILGVSGCVAVALAHTPRPVVYPENTSQNTLNTLADNDMEHFYAKIADFGIELKPLDGVPSVTEDTAIAIAKHNAPITGDADHITTMYTSFSDYPAGPDGSPLIMPGTNRIMKDVPVWIVTFHGVQLLHLGGQVMIDASGKQIPSTTSQYWFGDANVVLDAETGEVLEGFSYNSPRQLRTSVGELPVS